ncbi:hypothetical protein [Sedimentibacter sp.]|uniref:hypothetical protein n=1 Tax=Sedimentibacter sp. TaxID=1960295 RepID=UPI0028AA7D99|nr:hypothetical protein [Sedimentibacter sp.]
MKKRITMFLLSLIMMLVFALPVYADSYENPYYESNEDYLQYDNLAEAFEAFEKTIVLDEWYEWFNKLTPEEQETINYRPKNFEETQSDKYRNDYTNASTVIQVDPLMTTNDKKSDLLKTEDVGIMATLPTSGWELPYNPSFWNSSSVKPYTNCYCYALNVVTVWDKGMNPGYLSGKTLLPENLSTSILETYIKADMPYIESYTKWNNIGETSTPAAKSYKVGMCFAPGRDYHFYRQDDDGYWSHKRGASDLIFWDASQANIVNPRTCDRNYSSVNYSTWCGFYQYTYTN